MATTKVTNRFGELASWAKVKISLFGRELEGVTAIKYTETEDMENVYGAGNLPIGQGRGNISFEGEIELLQEEKRAIEKSLPEGTRIQDIPGFPIKVLFEQNDEVITDVLKSCRFMDNGVEVKQGDKFIVSKHKLLISNINYNVNR